MQLLHWLFKVAQKQQDREANKRSVVADEKARSKELVLSNEKPGVKPKSVRFQEGDTKQKKLHSFTIVLTRGNAKAYFFRSLNLKGLGRSLNLKGLGSFRGKLHCLHPVRVEEERNGMGHKGDSPAHVGNKVLPISDATTLPASTTKNSQCGSSDKKDKPTGDRTKTLSRMKELLKWAAAAKSNQGGKFIGRKVMQFRNRGSVKAVVQDDALSSSSPKISFRWDAESCSTTTSAYTTTSMPSLLQDDRKWTKLSTDNRPDGVLDLNSDECNKEVLNWITTDDEYVVLEL